MLLRIQVEDFLILQGTCTLNVWDLVHRSGLMSSEHVTFY